MSDTHAPPAARRTFAWMRRWFVWIPAVVVVSCAAAVGAWVLLNSDRPFPAVTLMTSGGGEGELLVVRIADDGTIKTSAVANRVNGTVYKLVYVGNKLYAVISHSQFGRDLPTGLYELDRSSGSSTLVAKLHPDEFWDATATHFVLRYPGGIRLMLPTGSIEDVPCDSIEASRRGVVTTSGTAVVFVNGEGGLTRLNLADKSLETLPLVLPTQQLLGCTDTHVVIGNLMGGYAVVIALDGSLPNRTLDGKFYLACNAGSDLLLFTHWDVPAMTDVTRLSSGARFRIPECVFGAVAYAGNGAAK